MVDAGADGVVVVGWAEVDVGLVKAGVRKAERKRMTVFSFIVLSTRMLGVVWLESLFDDDPLVNSLSLELALRAA